MPCTVFGFSFALFTSQFDRLCRRLCRPQRCPSGMSTPAAFAAGQVVRHNCAPKNDLVTLVGGPFFWALAKIFWVTSIFARPRMSRKTSHLAPSRSMAERHGAEAPKVPLALDRAVCGFRRKLPNIRRRHGDFRKRTYDVCNRLALVFFYRGCQKGVDDRSRVRPGHLHRHTRDLSALIDVSSRDYVEVGASGKQLVKVEHPPVLPDEA